MTAEALIAFESGVKASWESGFLPSLIHLCGGNENQLIEIFKEIKQGDWVFSTHRTHYHALLAGIDRRLLSLKIADGDSMFVYSKERNFLCSAVLAGCCGIAAGIAWAIKNEWKPPIFGWDSFDGKDANVWCFIGDGGEEQGHFYEAALFIEANDLPCTFIIEDNDRSVDTPRSYRRGSAKGLEHLFKCVRRYHYIPTFPHAGSGCNFKIEFDKEAIERLKRR
jgi:pyruvate dehydrogenase E1 component alpha subunit